MPLRYETTVKTAQDAVLRGRCYAISMNPLSEGWNYCSYKRLRKKFFLGRWCDGGQSLFSRRDGQGKSLETSLFQGYSHGSGRRIRTLTNRVRVCRATLTQSRYIPLFAPPSLRDENDYTMVFQFVKEKFHFFIFFQFDSPTGGIPVPAWQFRCVC